MASEKIRITADKVKRTSLLLKATSVLCAILLALSAVAYAVSYFYDKFGSFTVSVSRYDMAKQGLSLSETPEFDKPIARLSANSLKTITNISGDSIAENVDSISGSHNGSNYIAYTFYLKNTGQDTVSYNYTVTMSNISGGVDEAVRVRLYRNGDSITYAKTKADGSGPERNTTEFISLSIAADERRYDFVPGDTDRFTVVIWLEGDDPECLDNIIGGKIKFDMNIGIIESS